jgi:hypothetical protein
MEINWEEIKETTRQAIQKAYKIYEKSGEGNYFFIAFRHLSLENDILPLVDSSVEEYKEKVSKILKEILSYGISPDNSNIALDEDLKISSWEGIKAFSDIFEKNLAGRLGTDDWDLSIIIRNELKELWKKYQQISIKKLGQEFFILRYATLEDLKENLEEFRKYFENMEKPYNLSKTEFERFLKEIVGDNVRISLDFNEFEKDFENFINRERDYEINLLDLLRNIKDKYPPVFIKSFNQFLLSKEEDRIKNSLKKSIKFNSEEYRETEIKIFEELMENWLQNIKHDWFLSESFTLQKLKSSFVNASTEEYFHKLLAESFIIPMERTANFLSIDKPFDIVKALDPNLIKSFKLAKEKGWDLNNLSLNRLTNLLLKDYLPKESLLLKYILEHNFSNQLKKTQKLNRTLSMDNVHKNNRKRKL